MTSERSKRRDFLSLIFIAKSISKKLLIKIHKLCAKTLLNLEELLRMQKVARNEKSCSKYENLPSKLVESPISRNWKLRTEATTGRVWAPLLRAGGVCFVAGFKVQC